MFEQVLGVALLLVALALLHAHCGVVLVDIVHIYFIIDDRPIMRNLCGPKYPHKAHLDPKLPLAKSQERMACWGACWMERCDEKWESKM